jgi:acyl-coenzyme A synthetase/AMP-(fatty) acid ligase
VALLAVASIGAIWSSSSPDMGPVSVLDRFRQIEPKVLIAVDGYRYGGKDFDRRDTCASWSRSCPGEGGGAGALPRSGRHAGGDRACRPGRRAACR